MPWECSIITMLLVQARKTGKALEHVDAALKLSALSLSRISCSSRKWSRGAIKHRPAQSGGLCNRGNEMKGQSSRFLDASKIICDGKVDNWTETSGLRHGNDREKLEFYDNMKWKSVFLFYSLLIKYWSGQWLFYVFEGFG